MIKNYNIKVLLLVDDLYEKVADGGEVVYREIIKQSPDVDFYYFINNEHKEQKRPSNCFAIELLDCKNVFILQPLLLVDQHEKFVVNKLDKYMRSLCAYSHNLFFDIIEFPDYQRFGSYVPIILNKYHIFYKKIILAYHGSIAFTSGVNWFANTFLPKDTIRHEIDQYNTVDAVYGLKHGFIKKWPHMVERSLYTIDPLNFIFPHIENRKNVKSLPALYAVGRLERCKGNDLFIELLKSLNSLSYDNVIHLGSDLGIHGYPKTASEHLSDLASCRDIDYHYQPSVARHVLQDLYNNNIIVFALSRYDSFNLVTLEALFSGCPVVISSDCGICSYLDNCHPELPYIKFDLDDFYGSVVKVQYLIDHIWDYRRSISDYICKYDFSTIKPLDMELFYQQALATHSQDVNFYMNNLDYIVDMDTDSGIDLDIQDDDRNINHFVSVLSHHDICNEYSFLREVITLPDLYHHWNVLFDMAIHTDKMCYAKIHAIYNYEHYFLFRCNLWQKLSLLKQYTGYQEHALTYNLRLLRLCGQINQDLLPSTLSLIEANGIQNLHSPVFAMYGDDAQSCSNVLSYLRHTFTDNQFYNVKENDTLYEFITDHRSQSCYKVSIIVSLYNASNKLQTFLHSLLFHPLILNKDVEFIFIDSCSPTNEYKIYQDLQASHDIPSVYARTRQRETIQQAWNRAIALSSAPYLVFLGVDETLQRDALSVLSHHLDTHPYCDWVMSNSLITNVEDNGLYHSDNLYYNRADATPEHQYLETCYLSYVGGMYRKNIHDRFGYYDSSFKGAGDTEFKNRVFPHIQVDYINKTLGYFLNYNEQRTTESSLIEIEDTRAWYIHRTPGGICYAFDYKNIEVVENLLQHALSYRKSYCSDMSTDIEYSYYLSDYILRRKPHSPLALCVKNDLCYMLQGLRNIEYLKQYVPENKMMASLSHFFYNTKKIQQKHSSFLGKKLYYNIYNDNRYQQHSWNWKH